MKLIRRIFTISNIILAFAIALIPFSIRNFSAANIKFGELKKQVGVVEEKFMIIKVIDSQRKESTHIVRFKLANDDTEYSISFSPLAVNTLVNIGDSVEFFTKEIPNKKADLIPGNTKTPDSHIEIFHIISRKYPEPIVDLKDYRSSLRTNAWAGPILSVICFIWYFLRRKGIGSASVTFNLGR